MPFFSQIEALLSLKKVWLPPIYFLDDALQVAKHWYVF